MSSNYKVVYLPPIYDSKRFYTGIRKILSLMQTQEDAKVEKLCSLRKGKQGECK